MASATLPAQRAVRPVLTAALGIAGTAVRAGRQLVEREGAIEHWPIEQRATVPGAVAAATVISAIGAGAGRSFLTTRHLLHSYFGPGWSAASVKLV